MKKSRKYFLENKKKKNNRLFWISLIVIVTIITLSIGFSVFKQQLAINMSAIVRIEADIRVTGVSIVNSYNNASSSYEEYDVKNINVNTTLPNEDSYIVYKVQVTNFGNQEMAISSIDGLPDNLEYVLEYEDNKYNLKEKICTEEGCKLGIQKDIYIKIKYKDNMYNKENTNYSLIINFDFRPFYSVKYYGFDVDTSGYPQEILEGENLVINFDSQVETRYINVFVDGIKSNYQTDNNNTIIVNNISGDIIVRYKTLSEYILEIADGKKCYYNYQYFSISQTDSPCNGADGFYDTPPYYTYFWGTNDCLDFNYVWYSGYMWRITEILNDGKVKMISENILSAINFGQSAYFNDSYIKQWLNEDFLDTLYNHENILVEDATWDISPWYNWCWVDPPKIDTATVGLMNPYEFNKTAGYGSNSFLNLGHAWWLSSYSDPWIDIPTTVSGIHSDGTITAWAVPNNAFGVRPMVVLRADVKFSGAGTQDDPFVLLDDIPNANSGDPINTRTPGELVEINNMLYRIVNTHNEDGKKVTKLKSANYVTGSDGKVIIKKFGDMNSMHSYKDVVNSRDEQYWGAYLNGSWLTEDLKKYLVEDTYYVDNVQKETTDSYIGSYKNTICKDKNTTATTKDCEKTEKTWKGYVGLPIVGELFAYPLGGTDIHDYKTATMTPYGDSGYPMIGTFETETQGIFQETYDRDFAVKPTITLKEEVIITGGDGKTPDSAFKIALPEEYSSN